MIIETGATPGFQNTKTPATMREAGSLVGVFRDA